MQDQKPTVGRIVHYFSYGTPHGEYPAEVARAAIITAVHPAEAWQFQPVDLCVLNPTGMFFNQKVNRFDKDCKAPEYSKAGKWDWPVRD